MTRRENILVGPNGFAVIKHVQCTSVKTIRVCLQITVDAALKLHNACRFSYAAHHGRAALAADAARAVHEHSPILEHVPVCFHVRREVGELANIRPQGPFKVADATLVKISAVQEDRGLLI